MKEEWIQKAYEIAKERYAFCIHSSFMVVLVLCYEN